MTSAQIISLSREPSQRIQLPPMEESIEHYAACPSLFAVIKQFRAQHDNYNNNQQVQLKKITHEVIRIAIKLWNHQGAIDPQQSFDHFHDYAAYILDKFSLTIERQLFIEATATLIWQSHGMGKISLAECIHALGFIYRATGIHSVDVQEYLHKYFILSLKTWETQQQRPQSKTTQNFAQFFSDQTKAMATRMLWWRLI